MAEQPIFWLGGKPGGKKNEPQVPEAERYEPALRDACEACGFDVDEYVAAQGGFGGWLAHLERSGTRYRLFWNGKAKELTFEELGAHGGWTALRSDALDVSSLPEFVDAVRTVLQDGPEA